jgi:hypothetical protein
MESLDNTQLRERLMVAETLMKKLYNRNKELETYYSENKSTPSLD